jgi:hypothetical protein
VVVVGVVAVLVAGGSLPAQTQVARGGGLRPAATPAAVADASAASGGEPATAWLATTDPRLRVLFSFHREIECSAYCDRYVIWLRYAEASSGTSASVTWQVASQTSCLDYWVDGRPEVACASFGQMAGRDRHGTDYVLLQMRATREQIDRMRKAGALMFQFGTQSFHLRADGRGALDRFLAESGGR